MKKKLFILLVVFFVTLVCFDNGYAESRVGKIILKEGKYFYLTTQDGIAIMICHKDNGTYLVDPLAENATNAYRGIDYSWQIRGFSKIENRVKEGESHELTREVEVEFAIQNEEIVLIIKNKFLLPTWVVD